MKRNQYGINFDLGVPLLSPEEFELLYVELNPEKKQRLIHWIEDKNEGPMIVAGQIGTGKTTLIEKAFQEASIVYDIQIKLDEDVPLYIRGAFWGVFLGKVINFAQKHQCNLKVFNLPEDLLGVKYTDKALKGLTKALCDKPLSISQFNDKRKLYHLIDENIEFIMQQLKGIIEKIQEKINRKIFVFAEGVDKFKNHTTDYMSLLDFLNFLSRYKTLYEANLSHIFGSKEKWHNSKKILLTCVSNEQITQVLTKRLGVYSKSREDILPLLSNLSGGNLRQGLRLLLEYDYALGIMKRDTKESLDFACRKAIGDLIAIPEVRLELELLKVVNRDKYIYPGTLKDFTILDYSQNAIYLNWVLIMDEADRELKWPASVNPLLVPAIKIIKDTPESPEIKMLRKWAESHEMSPFGLDFDISAADWNKYFDIIKNTTDSILPMHIMEIFENMAAYFLNPERKDKIIIAYESKELAKLANDFIIGKAGTWRAGKYKDVNYDDIPGGRLDIFLDKMYEEHNDGYSIIFEKKLTEADLIALDQRRDAFINYRMIWWIPYKDLKEYLQYWSQLRQFVRIYRLLEDFLGELKKEDIEQDLLILESIDFLKEHKIHIKKRLEKVLKSLKERSNA